MKLPPFLQKGVFCCFAPEINRFIIMEKTGNNNRLGTL
ncbi:MAG: hypothetical protein HPY66_1519 [Firmicutes bacterium]|nr:hypothetical protein [Bacillota bacterium]